MIKRLVRSSLILLASFCFLAQANTGWRENEMEVRIHLQNADDARKLSNLNLRGDIYSSGSALVYVIPAELYEIQKLGLSYDITISDLRGFYKDFWTRQQGALSYNQIISKMDSLEQAFPFLCKKIVFGYSSRGYELSALKITNNVSAEASKPQILFDAGIHGDEIVGPEMLIRLAFYLCTQSQTNNSVATLVDNREVWLYCMVNPEGRINTTRTNSAGVDLNRDYSYMWGSQPHGGATPSPCSQKETQAVRRCILQNQFSIHITYHSGMEAVLYPWGYKELEGHDVISHTNLGALYKNASTYSALPIMSSFSSYQTYGETIDFSYGVNGSACLTLESSISKSLNGSQIQEYFRKNLNAMLKMIECAGYGMVGTIVDSKSEAPVAALIVPTNAWPFYSSAESGRFNKYTKAGTYSLKVVANGYKSKIIDSIQISDSLSGDIKLTLDKDETSMSCWGYKLVECEKGSVGNSYNSLGPRDSVYFTINGTNGLVLDMQYPIQDVPGIDFKVYASGFYTIYVSQMLENTWKELGSASNDSGFDLAVAGLPCARYVKIVGNECSIDAVEGVWDYQKGIFTKDRLLNTNTDIISIVRDGKKILMKVEVEKPALITIYNTQGKVCWQKNAFSKKNVAHWQPDSTGTYVVRLFSNNKNLAVQRIEYTL